MNKPQLMANPLCVALAKMLVPVSLLVMSVAPYTVEAAAAPQCGDDYIGLKLTRYAGDDVDNPILAEHGVIADPSVLDAFAREYANCSHVSARNVYGIETPKTPEFFLYWLPNRLYGILTGDEQPPVGAESLDLTTPGGAGRALWLMHLAGYYSGVWLGRVQDAEYGSTAPNDKRPVNPSTTNDNIDNVYEFSVRQAYKTALHGTPDEVTAFNRSSLRTDPTRANTGYVDAATAIGFLMPMGNNAGQFGFDVAYLDAILPPSASIPADAKPFTDNYFTFDITKLLDATYALPEPSFLTRARAHMLAAQNGSVETRARLAEVINGDPLRAEQPLLTQQLAYFAVSEGMYRGAVGTTYMSFPLDQYDSLIAWAQYAVMANQAMSFHALNAYSTKDVDLGRRLAMETALWGAYLYVYVLGVTDTSHAGVTLANAVPCFAFVGGSCVAKADTDGAVSGTSDGGGSGGAGGGTTGGSGGGSGSAGSASSGSSGGGAIDLFTLLSLLCLGGIRAWSLRTRTAL